ncbi:MAG: hypothetical protein JW384_02012 [Nitrosomonadaceae bacterium]|nr:hypothetical protein [Nitrosomonadaceae bacterium]
MDSEVAGRNVIPRSLSCSLIHNFKKALTIAAVVVLSRIAAHYADEAPSRKAMAQRFLKREQYKILTLPFQYASLSRRLQNDSNSSSTPPKDNHSMF